MEAVGGWWLRQGKLSKLFVILGGLAAFGAVIPHPPREPTATQTIATSANDSEVLVATAKRRLLATSDHPTLVRFGNVWSPNRGVVCGVAHGAVRAGKVWFVVDDDTLYQFTETDINFAQIHRNHERFRVSALSDHIPGFATYRGYCE